jgi:hypothetical protein
VLRLGGALHLLCHDAGLRRALGMAPRPTEDEEWQLAARAQQARPYSPPGLQAAASTPTMSPPHTSRPQQQGGLRQELDFIAFRAIAMAHRARFGGGSVLLSAPAAAEPEPEPEPEPAMGSSLAAGSGAPKPPARRLWLAVDEEVVVAAATSQQQRQLSPPLWAAPAPASPRGAQPRPPAQAQLLPPKEEASAAAAAAVVTPVVSRVLAEQRRRLSRPLSPSALSSFKALPRLPPHGGGGDEVGLPRSHRISRPLPARNLAVHGSPRGGVPLAVAPARTGSASTPRPKTHTASVAPARDGGGGMAAEIDQLLAQLRAAPSLLAPTAAARVAVAEEEGQEEEALLLAPTPPPELPAALPPPPLPQLPPLRALGGADGRAPPSPQRTAGGVVAAAAAAAAARAVPPATTPDTAAAAAAATTTDPAALHKAAQEARLEQLLREGKEAELVRLRQELAHERAQRRRLQERTQERVAQEAATTAAAVGRAEEAVRDSRY